MKKVLVLASVVSMIEQFNRNNIEILQNLGFEVHVATNFVDSGTISYEKSMEFKKELELNGVITHQIDFSRKIYNIVSIKRSFDELKKLVLNYHFSLVHMHSPIGGVIGRLVFKKYSPQTKVIYTAHGFQFFKNGPQKDWLIFYPIEKYLSRYTDVLITINNMDYNLAKDKFHTSNIIKIPGVGIDVSPIDNLKDKELIRKELGIPNSAFLIVSVGELSSRKNHEVVIRAIHKLADNDIYYVICGVGEKEKYLKALINELNLSQRVFLLGYRDDKLDILNASDISAFPSKREGLGLAGLEAMSVGLPLVSSNVQGIGDYQENGKTGYICFENSINEYMKYINILKNSSQKDKEAISKYNLMKVKKYDYRIVNKLMKEIYKDI